MCRLAAYAGPSIPLQNIIASPAHSLLKQSIAAKETQFTVNGDGFGVCWYGLDSQPGQYRDILPAWSDSNLTSICRLVESTLFMAHVRAATNGETSRANCHPFIFGDWSFMHNGQIPHIARIRRALESELPDSLYNARSGTTDSELFFLLLLALGFEDNPQDAWEQAYTRISQTHRLDDPPIRMTCVISNGSTIYAFRRSSDQQSPSLYQSTQLDNGGHALASEPLDKQSKNWLQVPESCSCVMDATGTVQYPLN